jgi:hypothetical protein
MPENEGASLELWANAIEHKQGAHEAQLGGWEDTRGRAHVPTPRPPSTVHVLALNLAAAKQLGLRHAPPKNQRPQGVPPKDGGLAARALPSEADVYRAEATAHKCQPNAPRLCNKSVFDGEEPNLPVVHLPLCASRQR